MSAYSSPVGQIVAVRRTAEETYSVPAMVVEDRGDALLVRFAAGNCRLVALDLIDSATPAEIEEFEQAARAGLYEFCQS